MYFSISILSAFATALSASAIPRSSVVPLSDDQSPVSPYFTDFYNCHGSSMCPTVKVQACDVAVNHKLIRDDVLNYGSEWYVSTHAIRLLCIS